EPDWGRSLRDRLKGVAERLGAVRDTEVLRDRLRSREPSLPEADRKGLDELVTSLELARDEAREQLLEAIREPTYVALLDELVEAARAPRVLEAAADAPAASEHRSALERPWQHLEHAVERAREDASDASLHAV